jgi:acetylornithine deacetylase/succinyl-diaminopimelate desuccinylase-like protein
MRVAAFLLVATVIASAAGAQETAAAAARRYRIAHQQAILDELMAFLAIPNLAGTPSIERNAEALAAMFAKRGVKARTLRVAGAAPLVVADVAAPGAKQTIAFYAHYDGQPVDPAQWSTPPFEPVLKDGRIYARSASDDKGPIVALLAALDALRAASIRPAANLKFVFEGEEEAGSPYLADYLDKYRSELAADAWMLCDGPVHQSRRMLLYFGARGVVGLELTVYGAVRTLHSGHYGNWAPNPIVTLTRLLGSMRDTEARILIPRFYDDVKPLGAAERAALDRAPPFDDEIRRELAIGRIEGAGLLNERILQPALNLRGISAGHVGEKASNSIPTEAHASIDFRLVPAQTPDRVRELVEDHVRKQGFTIVRETPDTAARLAHPNIVRMTWDYGYPAARTAIDLPVSRRVIEIVAGATGREPVVLPSLGGSIPMYLFQDGGTPVIGVPIVNHDNNQHAANENLRIQNLWDGIEVFAALMGSDLPFTLSLRPVEPGGAEQRSTGRRERVKRRSDPVRSPGGVAGRGR